MSHFTVAVITDSIDNLEKLLAPFQENNMGDCPKEYLVFTDVEPDCKTEYETKSVERIEMPDGRLLLPWDDEFRRSGSISFGTNTHLVPEHLKRVQVPYKETYPTFEQFAEEWHGYSKDQETGKYGYWENPNKKWDWWTIGGRWKGLLKLKDGTVADYARIMDVAFTDDFGTYAVITPDGKWHSKGEMGWFGMSSETEEESQQFNKTYHENFIANANQEHYIVIVDCHI